jgi:hypothetical protein
MGILRLWITEVTRMHGDRICIAGIDEAGMTCRPILRARPWTLADRERHDLRVGSVVEFELTGEVDTDDFPHATENCLVTPSPRLIRTVAAEALARRLAPRASRSISEAFGGYAQGGNRWVLPGTTCPSLGAIVVARAEAAVTIAEGGRVRIALPGCSGSLPVTDLALLAQAASPRGEALWRFLDRAPRLYIRLGLAHKWAPADGGEPERCWIQVNAITPIP